VSGAAATGCGRWQWSGIRRCAPLMSKQPATRILRHALCNANTGQVAHDTAGMYAAKYTLAHPSRVRSLNLLNSPLDAGAASLLPLWVLWLPGAPQMLAANAPIALTAMVLRR
jgi:pimeloyl-ACP methyl ester carboxylesterase